MGLRINTNIASLTAQKNLSRSQLALERSRWQADPAGWPYPLATYLDLITVEPVTVRMPAGEFKLRTSEYQREDRPDWRIYGGYLFIANGETTPWPERVRLLAFQLKEKYAYYAKVQFTMYAAADVETDDFVELVSDLLAELLPELMRCLPDWAEVESWSHAPSTNLDE